MLENACPCYVIMLAIGTRNSHTESNIVKTCTNSHIPHIIDVGIAIQRCLSERGGIQLGSLVLGRWC